MHDRGHDRASPKKLGRYVLHHEFAAGGMASVYFGQLLGPVGFSRVVAIKRMHAIFARDPKLVTMFVDEAWLAARVQHPNVVSVLDVVTDEGELFLVMDYVRGESLSGLMRAASAPPPADIAASILGQALSGLHAAHEARDEVGRPLGMIHRDVSPQNILVGVDGLARITDFGIAKAASRLTVTMESQLKGKLRYMSPEQLSGQPRIDRRADVYAAGVVLWETLAGARLTRGDTVDEVLTAMLEPPPSLRARRPELPASIDGVVGRALAVDPDDRYSTADELQIAIESALPFASPRAVGEWVQEVARDRLAEKKAVVDLIEKAVPSRAVVKQELASLSQEVRAEEARRLERERAPAPRAPEPRPAHPEMPDHPGPPSEVTRVEGPPSAALAHAATAPPSPEAFATVRMAAPPLDASPPRPVFPATEKMAAFGKSGTISLKASSGPIDLDDIATLKAKDAHRAPSDIGRAIAPPTPRPIAPPRTHPPPKRPRRLGLVIGLTLAGVVACAVILALLLLRSPESEGPAKSGSARGSGAPASPSAR